VYLANGFNGVKAARTAGYKGDDNVMAVTASNNLRNPKIAQLIEQRIREMAMSADEAMARLSQHARGNLGDFLGLSPEELKQHPQSHLLKKVKITNRSGGRGEDRWTEVRTEFEIYDAQAADLAVLKEQHLRAGEATERSETVDKTLDDAERVKRLTAILNLGRDRRDGSTAPGDGDAGT